MKYANLDNILCWVGNLIILSALFYVVFVLGHSGWWFAIFVIFHFTESHKQYDN